MNIENILGKIGLNERQIKVYLAVLELGESTVLPISKKCGIKRTYCYDILADLQREGLVYYIERNNRRQYVAENPESIGEKLKNKMNDFEKILPELKSIYNVSELKPKIRFYEGKDGIMSIYNQLLSVKEFEAISSPKNIVESLGVDFCDFSKKMLIKKIKVRELIAKDGLNVAYILNYKKPLQEVRVLPANINMTTDIIIFEDKVAMISYAGKMHGVLIENSSIVSTHKQIFEMLWRCQSK